MNPKTGTCRQFYTKDSLIKLPHNRIYALYNDQQGNLWIGTQKGLLCYNPAEKTSKRYFKRQDIRCILQEQNGTLWICTPKGLFYLKNGQEYKYDLSAILDKLSNPFGIKGFPTRIAYLDSQNRLWAGAEWSKGLICINLQTDQISTYAYNQYIRGISEDEKGRIWVAGSSALSYIDPNTEFQDVFTFETDNPFHTEGNELTFCNSLMKDHQNGIWMVTESEGLYYYHPQK